jgi:tRNA (guanine6-N2)-methyltransferase
MTQNGQFLARCLRGLEWALAAEVEGRGGQLAAAGHREVRFDDASATAERLALRAADDVFLAVGEIAGIDHTRASLRRLQNGVSDPPWRAAWEVLRRIRPDAGWRMMTVVASFLGKRNYNRYEIEAHAGPPLASLLGIPFTPSRELRTLRDTLTVRIHIVDQLATFALRIFDQPLHRRAYKTHSPIGTLHPPLAYAMGMVAGLREHTSMLDPFCGAGTIAIEAKILQPSAQVFGADIDEARLGDSRANARAAGADVHWLRADAGQLPFGSGTFDRIVTNPPWGGAVAASGSLATSSKAELAQTFESTLSEDARVVVLLDFQDTGPEQFLVGSLQLQFQATISVFGQHPHLCVFGRGAANTPFDLKAPFGDELERCVPWVAQRLAS